MRVIRSLRGCTLILAVALAACGGNAGSDTSTDASTAPPASTVPPTTSAPVPDPAPATAATTAAATEVAPTAPGGEDIYKKTCAMCHATPAMGAPVVGNKADWADRATQGKDTLYKHALEGFSGNKGMMPARGGNTSLDDAAVKSAVDFMVANSQ